ncbi:prepilin peptidase [Pseudalkalibacillus decolorationis]|uniref:prepilin peptidase n=1 Tax=Pseudalkalibacillus decolorationis TaxID=163879 RepID=UPI0021498F31|nr:A24 family peptidase [Pseudalkalibacillus decolorationis]
MYILFFLFGLIMGSFFNVVGLRVPKKESLIWPGSHCTNCQTSLKVIDLVPVVSYIFTYGKCRYCGREISFIYPTIEGLTGILFAYSYIQFESPFALFGAILLISLLMIVFVTDISYLIIPDRVLIVFAISFILYRVWVPTTPWWGAWLGALLGFGLLLLFAILSRGGMGGGDIKLFAVLGLMFGWIDIFLVLFLASLVGSIFGVSMLLLRKVQRKQHIPFGPFIVTAAIIVLFWGEQIWRLYF